MNETKTEEPVNGNAAPVTADEIIAPLGERMPPVTEGQTSEPLPTAQKVEVVTEQPKGNPQIDDKGIAFNPEKHAVDENGNPKKNKFGSFYSKNVGQKGKLDGINSIQGTPQRSAPSFNVPGSEQAKVVETPQVDEYEMMAEVYLQSAYGPAMIAFTEHARPDKEQHAALKQSLAAWLRHKKAKELSPGWGFAVTAAAVVVAKSEHPAVKERGLTWLNKIKGWFNKDKK